MKIYEKSVRPLAKEIECSNEKRILLGGCPGSGKTTTLEYLKEKNKYNINNVYIDVSLDYLDNIFIYDNELYNLFHISLIIQKILQYIKNNYEELYLQFFNIFNFKIERIILDIKIMCMIDDFSNKYTMINNILCKNPTILIQELLYILKVMPFKTITLIIDNFDSVNSIKYQSLIFNSLKDYFRVILTISDQSILNDEERLEYLKQDSDLLLIEYNTNPYIVRNILDTLIIEKNLITIEELFAKRFSKIISFEVLNILIKETNGNIRLMLDILIDFYRQIELKEKDEYDNTLLSIMNMHINNASYTYNVRKLHI